MAKFSGVCVPLTQQILDTGSTPTINIDYSIKADCLVDVNDDDSIVKISDGTKYRVVKAARYESKTNILCSSDLNRPVSI